MQPSDKIMIKYLLGELSEEEQIRLENQYVSDSDCFDRLLVTQDALIDDYVRNRLSDGDREKFEKYFLVTPERHEKVEFARALMQVLAARPNVTGPEARAVRQVITADAEMQPAAKRSPPRPRSGWQALLDFFLTPKPALAFVLMMLFIGSWLFVQNFNLRRHLERLEAEQMRLRQQDQALQQQVIEQREQSKRLAEQLEREMSQRTVLEQGLANASRSQPMALSFVLTPGLLRGGEAAQKIVISPKAQTVRLQLDLETQVEYESYRGALRTVSGNEIWSQDLLAAHRTDAGRAVFLTLPAAVLAEDDYIITLNGVNAAGGFDKLGTYGFNVLKK